MAQLAQDPIVGGDRGFDRRQPGCLPGESCIARGMRSVNVNISFLFFFKTLLASLFYMNFSLSDLLARLHSTAEPTRRLGEETVLVSRSHPPCCRRA